MPRTLSRGPHRFPVALLWIAMMLLFSAVTVACSEEDPTPAPAPTQAPTAAPSATPTPTPDVSVSTEIEFWELSSSSTGQDLVALLTEEEAACLKNELGTRYARMLEAPLAGEAGALLEEGGSDAFPLPRCFTVERGASMSLSLFSAAADGFSAGTQECMLQLLSDDPAIAEALGRGQAFIDGPAILEVVACLTTEETEALVPPGEGPPPDTTGLACLMEELVGTSSGERILDVLSGADTSGEGLTTVESAVLGRAVESCGIETGFTFPSPESTASPILTTVPTATLEVTGSDVWRGLVVSPEDRCSPYDSDDYPYSQSVERRIVASMGGIIYGPYTGMWFDSTSETDIEHIVARSEAHDSGLCAADAATRRQFAADPINLTLASPSVNRHQKSAKDAAEWVPDLNQCWFADRVVEVRKRYGLTIDERERDALENILSDCTSTEMIVREAPLAPTPTATVAQGNGAANNALEMYDDNGNGRITCAEARNHGIAPVRRGHPAYEYMNDADNDGVVCE